MIPDRLEKYSRQQILTAIGPTGQDAIFKAKVGIFGLGGLGSWSSLLLAQMGVGFLRLIDRDVVELSNLARTPIYTIESVDLPKVEQAGIFLKKINPELTTEELATNIDEFSIDSLVKDLDIVIDGLDNISTRLIINRVCKKNNIPYIFAGAIGVSANVSTFLYGSNQPCLNCIFDNVDDNDLEKCDILGVHPAILTMAASLQVSEAIKIITNNNPILISKIAYIYLDTLEIDHISIKKNTFCSVCYPKTNQEITQKTKILELCGSKTFLIPNKSHNNVDLEKISINLLEQKFKIIKKGNLGLTFEFNDIIVSIFKNGNLMLRGESNIEKNEKIYSIIYQKFLS
jgi:adenylyltransferase/sulfurtransferase